jgi:hypothetical protein
MDLTAFQELIASLVGSDDSGLSPGDVGRAAGLAINQYSVNKPRRPTEDLAVVLSGVLDLPSAWQAGFSQVVSIEFPIGENPPKFLFHDQWYLYDALEDVQELRLLAGPDVGESVRLRFTARHTSSATITAEDLGDVAALAAALLCDQLAARFGHSTDALVVADSVNHQSKGGFFASRARALRGQYESKFGKPTTLGAASSVVTLERTASDGGQRMYR